jgi:hypothetical protein
MRTWIIEKKKNLSERIQKETETEFKKKKEEDKAPLFVVEIYDASNTQFKYVREIREASV